MDMAGFANIREIGVLREEPIPRVDGVRAGDLRRRNDVRNIEIAFRGRAGTDADRLVRQLHMHAIAVCLGMHRDCF